MTVALGAVAFSAFSSLQSHVLFKYAMATSTAAISADDEDDVIVVGVVSCFLMVLAGIIR